MGSVNQFLYQKMVLLAQSFWVSVWAYLIPLFSFIFRYFFRFREDDSSGTNCSESHLQEIKQTDLTCSDTGKEAGEEAEHDAVKLEDSEAEEETPKSFLSFKFQAYEEFAKTLEGNVNSVSSETVSTNKCEFKHGNDVSSFLEEPEDVSFPVNEPNPNSNSNSNSNDGSSLQNDFLQQNSEAEAFQGQVSENSPKLSHFPEKEQPPFFQKKDAQFLSPEDFSASDSNSEESTNGSPETFESVDSRSNGFLSDKDFEGLDNFIDIGGQQVELSELMKEVVLGTDDYDDDGFHQELQRLEQSELHAASGMLSEEDFDQERVNPEEEEHGGRAVGNKNNLDETEDSNRLETLWEHQELIEQLKMELRKVRATGLPTILEESESPKVMEDLKPWKIEDKFHHEERMDELHKIYKLYSERMRKFDILNYQKMYAIGFLQLKDPLRSISGQKTSVPAFTSLLSQNFWPKKSVTDPMVKFIRELHSDLEMVYVGQLCLSWEFLHWQYERALELWESDPRGVRTYNEVAGEFQQFQVLMQRFIENEPYQGPRVQNYVKNRCVLRNVLQVPVMREDSLKDRKRAARRKGPDNDTITSDMLVEIMEESIRIFWRFVRADKPESKRRKGTHVELQNPEESQLLMEIRTSLQKKEKRLKEILRSGKCILKKLQRHNNKEEDGDQVLYFFSQVDMKLVARVLSMSRITSEQLVWCRNKLNNINFVSRRIHVEPSFLLFPC